MRTIELLAPAKNADIGIEAIRHGADAVYIGGPAYGARAAVGNAVADIKRLCDYAHIFGAKVYVTLNTILYDDELPEVPQLVSELYEAGVDALITQDLALLSTPLPPIALHASTQMDNCTPERAQFLEAAGYSQIVLARELSLSQIRDIHTATSLPLEAFVHGALCVSYSGRCYASQYCFKRSANRGRCAQFCRLSFDLVDARGEVLAANQHLLSLRDMRRIEHLEAMMDAGISSFKIEGRLKDLGYVKNVTASYRRAIDSIIARRPQDFRRSSAGNSVSNFDPQLDKSFNRGFTDYFLEGRKADIWNFATPKSMGEEVGVVKRVGKRSIVIDGHKAINNGDGLVFIDSQGKLQGFRANRVEGREVFPFSMPALTHGTRLYRNEDRVWENLMQKHTAERVLPLSFTLEEVADGYELTAAVGAVCCTQKIETEVQVAARPQYDNIVRNLSKLGGTPFSAERVDVRTQGERFIPASLLSDARRQLLQQLQDALIAHHLETRDCRRPAAPTLKAAAHYSYSANVANTPARTWLEQHGAKQVDPAFEVQQPSKGAIMTCRHCLRYAFGQCPQATGQRPTWSEPVSLRLSDGRMFPLRFDCKRCEMQVMLPES